EPPPGPRRAGHDERDVERGGGTGTQHALEPPPPPSAEETPGWGRAGGLGRARPEVRRARGHRDRTTQRIDHCALARAVRPEKGDHRPEPPSRRGRQPTAKLGYRCGVADVAGQLRVDLEPPATLEREVEA